MDKKYYKLNIKNVFWMYSYIIKDFKNVQYEACLSSNDYHEVIVTEIIKTWNKLINIGLLTTQVVNNKNSTSIKGKINWNKSMLTLPLQKVNQEIYELDYNLNWNKQLILKLSKIVNIKSKLKNFYIYSKVIQIDKNKTYEELENINQVFKTKLYKYLFFLLMLKDKIGESQYNKIKFDHHQFELFVYEFYNQKIKKEFNVEKQKRHKFISNSIYSPILIPDIIVMNNNVPKLIIDTKYYKYVLSENNKFISSHIYQMCTYLENVEYQQTYFNKGIILYATDTSNLMLEHNQELIMKQNKKVIKIQTINLNSSVSQISNDLLNLIK